MKNRLHNISIIAVTIFFCSCGVNGKLDENIAEMHAMNKNMADMNKIMNSQLTQANQNVLTMNDNMAKNFSPMNESAQSVAASLKEFEKLLGMMKHLEQMSTDMNDLKKLADRINALMDKFLDGKKSYDPEETPEEFFRKK